MHMARTTKHPYRLARVCTIGIILAFLLTTIGDSLACSQDFFGDITQDSNVRVTAAVTRTEAVGYVLLVKTQIEPGWHIYSLTQKGGPVATRIDLAFPEGVRAVGPFVVYPDPERKTEAAFPGLIVETHSGTVVWAAGLAVEPTVSLSTLAIKGSLLAQPCRDDACLPPRKHEFTARWMDQGFVPQEVLERLISKLAVASGETTAPNEPPQTTPSDIGKNLGKTGGTTVASQPPGEVPREVAATTDTRELPWLPFTLARFRQLVGPEFQPERLQIQSSFSQRGRWDLPLFILLGFLGGIILNVMPCVLPVIGLKLLAFVQQAGESRLKAFWLNIWYSVGLLSVFALLAVLAITLQFGWGHLFRLPVFNVVMAAIVFVMALAFLGVWTMPIPGFVGTGKAVELTQKEGVLGAFFKGVFTTILATPCTGPFMGSALAWSFTQPPLVVLAVFMSVGLGMASPYLLIGAFPELIRFLPKPGAWMETFERLMGFVLLGTVVFIFTFLDWPYVVPTVGLLFGLWAVCWWIERAAFRGRRIEKIRAWGEGLAFLVIVWIILFPGLSVGGRRIGGLLAVMERRFQERALQVAWEVTNRGNSQPTLVEEGNPGMGGGYTVMVDCTADWCLTCKTLEATVLNTEKVRAAIRQNNVILLKADWTHAAPEVTQFLDWLGFRQVPVLAIFPADRPNEPIVFTGGYTQKDVIDALHRAGPSRK